MTSQDGLYKTVARVTSDVGRKFASFRTYKVFRSVYACVHVTYVCV